MVNDSFSIKSTVQLKFISLRLCFVHNKVNERLEKPIFDCAHLDDEYDCGCGRDSDDAADASTTLPSTTKDEVTGADLIRGGR
jgi:FAD-linked sulfhydryl oxidase